MRLFKKSNAVKRSQVRLSLLLALAMANLSGTLAAAQPDPPGEIWRPHPGEAYGPSIYCGWNRTGLPLEQQQICLERDRLNPPKNYRPKPGEHVEALLRGCQPGGATSCNDDMYQPVWKTIEADNGERTKIDMNSIQHPVDGSARAVTYTYVPGSAFDPSRLSFYMFDCHGHFRDTRAMGTMMDAPPRSVAGEIARTACAGAAVIRHDYSKDHQPPPTPAEYCVGFSPEACTRIAAIVRTKPKPSYCGPGFGLVGSGLDPEQLRACYVLAGSEH